MLQSSVKTTFHLHNKKSFWSFLWVTRRTGFWDKRIRQKSKYVPVYSILFYFLSSKKVVTMTGFESASSISSMLYHGTLPISCAAVLMTCVLCSDTVLCPCKLSCGTEYTVVSSTKKIFWDFSLRADIYKTCSWFKGSPHEKNGKKTWPANFIFVCIFTSPIFRALHLDGPCPILTRRWRNLTETKSALNKRVVWPRQDLNLHPQDGTWTRNL